jgi:hypothetical protein
VIRSAAVTVCGGGHKVAPPALPPLERTRFAWTKTRCSARHNAKAVQVVISGTSTFALPGALNKRD